VTQFIYLSKILGIDKANNDFLILDEKLSVIKNISKKDVRKISVKNTLISFGIGILGISMLLGGIDYGFFVILLAFVIFIWLFVLRRKEN